MPKFGKRSNTFLDTCHSDLRVLFKEIVVLFDCSVICGRRSKSEQDEAYHKGLSKLKYPKSKHNAEAPNLSMAADVVPYPINWKDTKRMYFFAGFVICRAKMLHSLGEIDHLIRWGGDWDKDTQVNDQSFMDLPHFELYKPKQH